MATKRTSRAADDALRKADTAPVVRDAVEVEAGREMQRHGRVREWGRGRASKGPGWDGKKILKPERAAHPLFRPFKAGLLFDSFPKALPWAGMFAHRWCSISAPRQMCLTRSKQPTQKMTWLQNTQSMLPSPLTNVALQS